MNFLPHHILKSNFDRYIESGGKSYISKKTEARLLKVFSLIFRGLVVGNLPTAVAVTMALAMRSATDGQWDDGGVIRRYIWALRDILKKAGIYDDFLREMKYLKEELGDNWIFELLEEHSDDRP